MDKSYSIITSQLHILTVFYKDVLHLAGKTILETLLVAFYHVGAEDSPVMIHGYVDARQSHISLQHSRAPFLRGKKSQTQDKQT